MVARSIARAPNHPAGRDAVTGEQDVDRDGGFSRAPTSVKRAPETAARTGNKLSISYNDVEQWWDSVHGVEQGMG